jgi:hypothetical protein
MTPPVEIAAITPQPSEEEVAAIVSALELAWPTRQTVGADPEQSGRWRFSGRWWTKPLPLRRGRP